MRNIKQIEEVVMQTLSKDFDTVRIIDVQVETDHDLDGDEILRVKVVFEGKQKDIDARKVSGALRHVRPKLSEIGELAFPLLSFISRGDAGRAIESA